jgi:hypothetical protein
MDTTLRSFKDIYRLACDNYDALGSASLNVTVNGLQMKVDLGLFTLYNWPKRLCVAILRRLCRHWDVDWDVGVVILNCLRVHVANITASATEAAPLARWPMNKHDMQARRISSAYVTESDLPGRVFCSVYCDDSSRGAFLLLLRSLLATMEEELEPPFHGDVVLLQLIKWSPAVERLACEPLAYLNLYCVAVSDRYKLWTGVFSTTVQMWCASPADATRAFCLWMETYSGRALTLYHAGGSVINLIDDNPEDLEAANLREAQACAIMKQEETAREEERAALASIAALCWKAVPFGILQEEFIAKAEHTAAQARRTWLALDKLVLAYRFGENVSFAAACAAPDELVVPRDWPVESLEHGMERFRQVLDKVGDDYSGPVLLRFVGRRDCNAIVESLFAGQATSVRKYAWDPQSVDEGRSVAVVAHETNTLRWEEVSGFLRGIRSAFVKPEPPVTPALDGVHALLLDRRLVRMRGCLINSYLAGAVLGFM